MNDKATLEVGQLRQFEPISALSDERLEELVSLAYVEKLGIGASLFREGDIDNQTVYLLRGDVQLSSSDGSIDKIINPRSKDAKFPLDDSQPRQASASAMNLVEVVRIDNSVLDYMMMWDQIAVSEATPALDESAADTTSGQKQAEPPEPDSEEDRSWLRKMHRVMAFKSMPPANIKRLIERMESVSMQTGDIVVRQGDSGDYFYVLTEGRAQVTRTVELANLEAGSSFGEEALLSGSKRNATVTMTGEGTVMRLAKKDFDKLLKEPMLNRVSPAEARTRVAKGAKWLDVRHAKEFIHSHLPDATNLPLHELRLRLNELGKNNQYICYCSTGRRSAAAAFLLAQQGFNASVLNGGVKVMPQDLVR